jgi:RNA polymerase-binding transcription factor DksA
MLPDPLDVASEQEMLRTAAALADQRAKAAPEQVPNDDGSWPTEDCVDCGEPIGEARLELGKVRCILCQEAKESRQKRGIK